MFRSERSKGKTKPKEHVSATISAPQISDKSVNENAGLCPENDLQNLEFNLGNTNYQVIS